MLKYIFIVSFLSAAFLLLGGTFISEQAALKEQCKPRAKSECKDKEGLVAEYRLCINESVSRCKEQISQSVN